MVKKIRLGILVLLFSIIAFTGCSSDKKDTATQEPPKQEATVQTKDNTNTTTSEDKKDTQESNEAKIGDEIKISNYSVKINSLRMVKDSDGKPSVVLNYKFTNNSEKTTNALVATYFKVFQDGEQLETAIILDGKDSSNSSKDLRPGKSIDNCEIGYVMNSDKDLEIEVMATEDMIAGKPVLIKTTAPK